MQSLKGFLRVLIASLVSFFVCAVLAYFIMVIIALWQILPTVNWAVALVIPFVVVMEGVLIGVPIIAVVAAPVYALLLNKGRASFPAAAVIGVLPGLMMLPFSRMFGLPSAAVGLMVGIATHEACRKIPKRSSKPTSLRGTA